MSTDFQTAREALGARLRQLRAEAGIDGKGLAEKLGWQRSKVSRMQTGKQTPSLDDLTAWAAGVGRPDVVEELHGLLASLEMKHRSWRRTLSSGQQARQELAITETAATRVIRGVEVTRIPGLFQTPEYARTVFEANAEFRQIPRTIDDAVRARIRRQEALYDPDKRFRFLIWEGALYVRLGRCEVMAAQLDRLFTVIGLDTVELGIIPFGRPLRRVPSHGFWIYDQRLVIVETISEELWLDGAEDVRLYERAWDWLSEAAVYGAQARSLIGHARGSLDLT